MFYWRLWALMSRYLRINGDWKLYWPSTFPPSRSLELACSLGSNILEVLLCRVFQFQRSLPNIVIFIQFTQRVDKSHPHRLKAKEFLYSLVQVSLWRSLAQSAWSYFSVCPVVRADNDAINRFPCQMPELSVQSISILSKGIRTKGVQIKTDEQDMLSR